MKRMTWEDDKATREWLGSQKAGTRSTYQTAWKHVLEFAKMTGDQILEDRKGDKEFAWEKKVLALKTWMIEEKKQSENTAKGAATAARSFFSFYRIPLKFRKTEKAKLAEAKRKTEDYRFSREDLKKMADFGDLTEKYIVVAGKSFGLRAGDFLRLTRGDLEAYIDREPPISIGEYHTEKENVNAFPFIDTDAKPIIKMMLGAMTREGKTDSNGRILNFSDERPLTQTLQRAADKAGINHGNKIIRFHCLRKFLTDHLSSHMSTEKWKQIVGKKISEGAYISPDSLREDYARAMAETTFTKPEGDAAEIASFSALEVFAEQILHVTKEQMTAWYGGKRRGMRRELTVKEKTEALKEKIREVQDAQKAQIASGCKDGEHCQRVVGEEELPDLLSKGWHVAAALPSGKVVVSDE